PARVHSRGLKQSVYSTEGREARRQPSRNNWLRSRRPEEAGALDGQSQGIKAMDTIKVAIAGFGCVGRATADVFLTRRNRYRQVYGVDLRLVAVCGSRSGLADAGGLESERLDVLEEGLSGPEFIEASGADILIEAGPSDFRTGSPGIAYISSSLTAGRDAIVISKGALAHSGPELRALARSSGATLKIS